MTLYMLDTDTSSYLIRGRMPALDQRVRDVPKKSLCISAVTRGELLYGLRIKDGAQRLTQLIDQYLQRITCLSWDEAAATHFAEIAATLHRSGNVIGTMDAMIAGHAQAAGAVLVTNNERHFTRIRTLAIENWLR